MSEDFALSNTGNDAVNAPNPRPQTEGGPSQISANQVIVDRTPLDILSARASIAADVFEAVAEGPEEALSTDAESASEGAEMKELVLRLRGLRREKESLLPTSHDLELPSQLLSRVNEELRALQEKLSTATSGRESAVALALGAETLSGEERERLQKLTELEARDSLQLEGLEIREALAEVSDKLRAIETDPAIQNVIHLMDAKKGPVVSDVEKASLLHAMDQLQKPPPEPQSPQGEGGFLEIYSSVSKTAAHDIEGLLKRYNEIDEKVSELETIVGVESFSSLTFCYNDITSALTHLTERLLLLDPRRMETMATKASVLHSSALQSAVSQEVATELDKALAMKAKIGGEVGYNPVVASEQKIEALYGLLENWAPTAHALPKLINKMKYISVLSRDAGELDSRLRGVEAELSDVKALLESSERSLDLVNNKTDEQISLMKTLLAKLDK